MKSIQVLLLALFVAAQAHGQINKALKKELDSMFALDQKYRTAMGTAETRGDSLAKAFGVKKDSLIDYLWKLQSRADESNMARVAAIIEKHGYPGKSLVGVPSNEAAFYIIQHSSVIDRYLPLLKEAAEKGELPFYLYTMMLDRSLMYQQKEQEYGTQGYGFETVDPVSKEKKFTMIIWPVRDPQNVNKRRKEAGFTQTVEENAKRLGIEYKVLSLEELKKLRGR
jgi:hypothetical protein